MTKKIYIFLLFLTLGFGFYFFHKGEKIEAAPIAVGDNKLVTNVIVPEKTDRIESFEIGEGTTFAELMTNQASTTYSQAMAIYHASQDVYDLVKIRQGRSIKLIYDKDSDELKELRYKIDSEDELFVEYQDGASSTKEWVSEKKAIPYVTKRRVVKGVVETSMYQAAMDHDIDIRAIIELANAFQWSIDFAMDPRVGDTFEFIYEERYLDGKYVMPGQVFAGKYVNAGEELALYYFEESEDNKGFFDKDGNSAQKMFLKAPVEFRYISSGYTTGSRKIMESHLNGRPHRAIDYAAAMGTPIRSVGDGVVTFAAWATGYGNFTKIRHNGTYSTNYAHQSKFAVKVGQRVKQGQVIGYVGSTGYSTGPHLHFEMVKNGVKINSLKEILPPGKPIKEENRERFFDLINTYDKEMSD